MYSIDLCDRINMKFITESCR